jgi:dipeptidyl aminopeptidase/acylaminoacyl peptidase
MTGLLKATKMCGAVLKSHAVTLAILAAGCSAHATSQPTDTHRLTIEQLLEIRHPSGPMWAPDGRSVVFVWDRGGVSKVYSADVGGGRPPRELPGAPSTHAPRTGDAPLLAAAFWSQDGRALLVPKDGDLWRVPIDGSAASAVWTTPQVETSIVASPDRSRVAFVRSAVDHGRGSDLFVRTLTDNRETLVFRSEDKLITAVNWSPDSQHLVFGVGAHTVRHDQTPPYSGTKIIYTISENVPGQAFVVHVSGGPPTPLGVEGGSSGGSGRRWIDARHFIVDRTSTDYKRRTMLLVDIAGGEPKILQEDVADKFWSMPGDANADAQPSPDGKWIAFVSDRDGWDHLYVMPAPGTSVDGAGKDATSQAVQITKGKFEAWRPQWSPDSTRIVFDANEPDHYGDRHIYVAAIHSDPAHATVTAITTGAGTDIAPKWSPDGTRLVYQHTDPHNSADLWIAEAGNARDAVTHRPPVRLTDSMPASMDRSVFVEPQMVKYPGPDGQTVPAWLFVPKDIDRSKKHPAIVWIHGAGINQNYNGWHVGSYKMYYSFHQYLLQQGYVVIAPDYRGSIGYGRVFRESVYMDVGGNDAKDAWMAAYYLKTLPYVDSDRIGVWGMSYGGFFTLIAVTDQPKLFRAAVDINGVVDYTMYYEDPYHGGWGVSRMGTPQQHADVYAKASPISHIDKLERPLLVLHGTADTNVPYLQSVRLVDELLKKGKGGLLSFMTYPGEFHYYASEHVLRDVWHRVESFFDAHLKASDVTSHD